MNVLRLFQPWKLIKSIWHDYFCCYQALAKTEDETDAVAVEQVKAEQKEELAEFDENIPWEEGERRDEESHVEQELAMLDKEVNTAISFNLSPSLLFATHEGHLPGNYPYFPMAKLY